MQLKKITVYILINILCISAFIFPFIKASDFVYAESVIPEGYSPAGYNDQVDAFIAYCKSRNIFIEGSVADGVTAGTTQLYQSALRGAGYDMNQLQNEIYKKTDSNTGLKWFFTSTGVTAMNRIFAEFLQNQDLEVGDTDVNKTIYSGRYFVDADGNGCLVYINPNINSNDTLALSYDCSFEAIGSDYRFSASELINYVGNSSYTINFHLTDNLYHSETLTYYTNETSSYVRNTITNSTAYNSGFKFYEHNRRKSDNTTYNAVANGRYIVSQRNGNLYLCSIANNSQNLFIDATTNTSLFYSEIKKIVNPQSQPANIIIISTEINNNIYEGDTIINNNGTPDDTDEPDPDDPTYNPYPPGGGTTTGPGETGGGDGSDDTDITFPNFNFQLPEIDWSLGDLSEKFPFSIPFDLIAFFTVLNAEPQAPSIDANIPLGSWYTWNFQADFSQFDNYAAIIRNVEFIAFCIGLIYLTIRLVKG